MAYKLTTNQKAELLIAPIDADGGAQEVENVVWEVNDPTLASIALDPADNKLKLFANDQGIVTVKVTADARIGDGVKNIIETFDVVIVHEAAALNAGLGQAEDKEPA